MNPDSIAIVDCHVHFVDAQALSYQIFQQRSASFEAIVGDYSALPRRYLPEDYLNDTRGFNVAKIVCAEFMSDDPIGEVRWALALSNEHGYPQGMIAQADFLSPDVARVIDSYGSIPRLRAVRQHLALDPQPMQSSLPRGRTSWLTMFGENGSHCCASMICDAR